MIDKTPAAEADEQDDVCPHCGAVLDLAQAMQNERSVLHPRAGRASARSPEALPAEAGPSDDPSVA